MQKNYQETWRPNALVFACEPGSVLGYLITLLCTASIYFSLNFLAATCISLF